MKKTLITMAGLLFAVCMLTGTIFSAESRKMTQEEVANLESQLFVNVDNMDTSDLTKFGEQLIQADGNDTDAKCWFWGRRFSYYYYYPTYYYYVWYCPCYYVNFRLVSYTVPVVETTTSVATTTDVTTTVIAKSTGRLGKGAVVDQKVPANSPLAKLGLRSGDIITSVDGNPVNALIDVRRIKANSNITYVRGNQIRVAGKPILQQTTATIAKSHEGMTQAAIDLNSIKSLQNKKISLYEYYDQQEKNAGQPAPAQEYGADQY